MIVTNQTQSRLSVCVDTLTVPMFPVPSLKFRTLGFLQYGFKVSISEEPSRILDNLKSYPDIRSTHIQFTSPFAINPYYSRLNPGYICFCRYQQCLAPLLPWISLTMVSHCLTISFQWHSRPLLIPSIAALPQRSLAPLWVMLSQWIIAYYDLIRGSLIHLLISYIIIVIQKVFALRDSMDWIKDLPHFTLYISLRMPSPVLGRGHQLLTAIYFVDDFSFRPIRQDSALSIPRPELSTLVGSKWFSVTKRQCSLYATASEVASPLSGTGRLHSSFHQRGHPLLMSNITIGVNGPFPEQDFHLQDIQHYGLQTDFTDLPDQLR